MREDAPAGLRVSASGHAGASPELSRACTHPARLLKGQGSKVHGQHDDGGDLPCRLSARKGATAHMTPSIPGALTSNKRTGQNQAVEIP
jgi:phosphoketolase